MDEFFRTPMGRTFLESTVPRLVKEVGRLADAMERSNGRAEKGPARPDGIHVVEMPDGTTRHFVFCTVQGRWAMSAEQPREEPRQCGDATGDGRRCSLPDGHYDRRHSRHSDGPTAWYSREDEDARHRR